ncbi:hypothetical protein ADL03_08850 [Nocardia sp. NRRL S-836]|nr:hypothetical protein ADL03_08850 [Nocardia sp. NRRL S-836]
MAEDGLDSLDRCVGFLGHNRSGLPNSLWARDTVVVERFATDLADDGLLTVMTRICRDKEPAVRLRSATAILGALSSALELFPAAPDTATGQFRRTYTTAKGSWQDHPRVRGKNCSWSGAGQSLSGPSPRARGERAGHR